jgi:hypothetical protein
MRIAFSIAIIGMYVRKRLANNSCMTERLS